MFFLLHGLGVLRVRIPQKFVEKANLVEGDATNNKVDKIINFLMSGIPHRLRFSNAFICYQLINGDPCVKLLQINSTRINFPSLHQFNCLYLFKNFSV